MTPVPAAERPKWYRTILVRIAIILVVVGFVAVLLGQAFNVTTSYQGRPFHDALGLFSATIPNGWSVSGGAQSRESYTFQDQQQGDTSATVNIGVTPLNNSSADCIPVRSPARFIDGIPASTPQVNPTVYLGTEYDFDSGNAYFQVTVFVVTVTNYFDGTPIPTPTVANPGATQAQAQDIVGSIKVTDHLPC